MGFVNKEFLWQNSNSLTDESIPHNMALPSKYRERLHRNFDRLVTDIELGPILLEMREKRKSHHI